MILVDSNILIDLLEEGSRWFDWSRRAVGASQGEGSLIVNAVIRAETAGRFADADEQSAFLDDLSIATVDIDAAAAFRAGRAFREYRRRGGAREAILADFLVGGHASALGAALLTRDRQRFAGYFPEVNIISPESDHD